MMANNGPKDDEKEWYVVNDPSTREYNGPFSVKDILTMIDDGKLHMEKSWAFKKDDTSMVVLKSIPGLERRRKQAEVSLPIPKIKVKRGQEESWWVGEPGKDPCGPYAVSELRRHLASGKYNRNSLVWQPGMNHWVYLYEIPGFERRSVG